jgi:hypothetical protein
MKNQYFGDVNDFRKYGLLRTLQRASGLVVGVCWFLTVDDGAGDGELRNYLNRPGRWRHYDPELYDNLQRLLGAEVQRSVSRASEWELVPGASYFDAVLRDHRLGRTEYFEAARQVLQNSDLVFVDPDNGIEVPSTKLGASGSSKYVYWTELRAMYADGQSILVYQHFPHVIRERFVPFIAGRLSEELDGSTVVAFFDGARGVLPCATTKARRGAREGRTGGGATMAWADRSLARCNQRGSLTLGFEKDAEDAPLTQNVMAALNATWHSSRDGRYRPIADVSKSAR